MIRRHKKAGTYLSIIAVVFFLFSNCNHIEKEEDKTVQIAVNVHKIQDVYDISEFVEDIDIIPLYEKPGFYLGAINKILFIKGKIIVLDKISSNQFLLFDDAGNFEKQLVPIGKGPGECFQINDCWVNNEGLLEAFDYASRQIFHFDAYFNLKKTTSYDQNRYLSIANIPNTNLYLAASQLNYYNKMDEQTQYELAVLNDNFSFRRGYLPIPQDLIGATVTTPESNFFNYDGTVRYFRTFDNYIYSISAEDSFEKIYYIDFSDKTLNRDIFRQLTVENDKMATFSTNKELFTYAFFYSDWYENKSFISFMAVSDSKRYNVIFDKEKRKSVSAYRFITEFNGDMIELPPLRFGRDNYKFAVLNTLDENLANSTLYKKFLSDLPEATNVIIKVKLRD